MPTYIALLRGINVGGHRKIRMADLRDACESLGLTQVQTYLQSGNLVFSSPARSAARVAVQLEGQIQATFGFDVTVIIRTSRELKRIIEGNPFARQAAADSTRVCVIFLAERPSKLHLERLASINAGADVFTVVARDIFIHYPSGAARTKLNNTCFERHLQQPATARNWRTVQALHDLVPDGGGAAR